MSDTPKKDFNQQALPFFARYLEGQINQEIEELSDEEMEVLAGGKKVTTEKYPSDRDEPNSGGTRPPMTRKYPSDKDEPNSGGGGGPIVTQKYPSDNDEPNSR